MVHLAMTMHCNWSTDHAIDHSSIGLSRLTIQLVSSMRSHCLQFLREHMAFTSQSQRTTLNSIIAVADLRGAQGILAPLWTKIVFIFMRFSGKNWSSMLASPLSGWHSPLGNAPLDLLLNMMQPCGNCSPLFCKKLCYALNLL